MKSKWRPPRTPSELEKFVDLIIEGKFAMEPPLRRLFCKGLARGNVCKELALAEDNSVRIDVVTPHFPYGRFRRMLRRIDTVLLKNCAVLNILQAKGDNFETTGDNQKALCCYTLSLNFAPTGSKPIVGIYMKRSVIFASMKKYELALMDIEMALRQDNPAALEVHLIKQRKIYEALIIPIVKSEEDLMREEFRDKTILRVRGQYHQPPSVLPDFISVEFDPYKGRFLVTNIDLEPGTTVLVEEPYVAVPVSILSWQRLQCHRCMKQTLNPIPCEGCVFYSYCGVECRSEDQKHGHQYECPLLPYAHAINMYEVEHMCLKSICKGGPHILKELYVKSKSASQVEDAWYIPVFDSQRNSDTYSQVLNMASHDRAGELPHSALIAVSLASALRIKTTFFDNIEESEKFGFQKFIATVFLHHSESFPYNMMGLGPVGIEIPDVRTYFEDMDDVRNSLAVTAIYPVVNLMNHSCAATAFRLQLPGGRVAIVTSGQLKAGEELSLSYGYEYHRMSFMARIISLAQFYHIKCECIACTEYWPTFAAMDTGDIRTFVCKPCKSNIKDILSRSSVKEIRDELFKCGNCTSTSKMVSCNPLSLILEKASELVLKNQPLQAIPILKECIKYLQCDPFQPTIELVKAQRRLVDSFDIITSTTTVMKEKKSAKIRNMLKKFCPTA